MFVSSHVMDEAERCERLMLMREGEIIAHDSPEAIMEPHRHRQRRGSLPQDRGDAA